MANLYNNAANNYSPSSAQEPDEISLFLQQILLRSSSSSASSSSLMRHHQSFATHCDRIVGENREPVVVPGPGQISVPELSTGLNSSSGCSFTARAIANLSSSSVGNLDNDPDEYDYESEEAVETFVEETAAKPTPPRSSSKRSRAAEVHNLSEKRRRSRINEKMKALQNLIPNSNKTDKASMLDEAIEYLKQLQLQVQMLTMRNGLSLYPICLPGMVQQNQNPQMTMDISERDKSLNLNMAKPISIDQNISDVLLNQNCVKQAPVVDFSTMNESKTSNELESSIQNHFGPFQFSISSKDKVPPRQHCPETNSAGKGFCVTSSAPFEAQPSALKENALEACLARGDRLLPTFADNHIFSSQLNM